MNQEILNREVEVNFNQDVSPCQRLIYNLTAAILLLSLLQAHFNLYVFFVLNSCLMLYSEKRVMRNILTLFSLLLGMIYLHSKEATSFQTNMIYYVFILRLLKMILVGIMMGILLSVVIIGCAAALIIKAMSYYRRYRNVRSLTRTLYQAVEDQLQKGQCSICLEDYNEMEEVCELRCKHEFHFRCVQEWLYKNERCPICRAEVYNEE